MEGSLARLGYVINARGIAQATGIQSLRAITGRGTGWGYGTTECWGPTAWDDLVKATGITRWVRSGGTGALAAWWPAEVITKAKAAGVVREGGRPIKWVEGRPCERWPTGEWSSHACERPAVEVLDGPVAVCSMHLKVTQRSAERSAAWRAQWAARDEARDRRRHHEQLGAEVLEWAGPLLADLGIHPATITVGSIGDRTGILLPAEAIATLVAEATGERYPGRPG